MKQNQNSFYGYPITEGFMKSLSPSLHRDNHLNL